MGRQLAHLSSLRSVLLATLQRHPLLTFVLMGLCFLGFGVTSFNLAVLLRANLALFWDYGWQAAMDGGVAQLLELTGWSYVGLACWLGFKCCEKLLVDRLTRQVEVDADAAA